eukprot:GHVT01000605.1.p1 GENE.GHVT01000605.1~~GHVT01000605.1.p1  ORF type:complete len:100 (+),score=2.52 GHVT01000605.1:188-487(+)
MSYDRFNIHAQLEHLQTKYPGTGHADVTKWEWASNIQRDTLASHVGHYSRLAYFAIAENEPIRRVKQRFLRVRSGKRQKHESNIHRQFYRAKHKKHNCF